MSQQSSRQAPRWTRLVAQRRRAVRERLRPSKALSHLPLARVPPAGPLLASSLVTRGCPCPPPPPPPLGSPPPRRQQERHVWLSFSAESALRKRRAHPRRGLEGRLRAPSTSPLRVRPGGGARLSRVSTARAQGGGARLGAGRGACLRRGPSAAARTGTRPEHGYLRRDPAERVPRH